MKTVNGNEVIQIFESWSPKKYACMPNDPIGLAIGTLNKPVSKVLVTLDVTHKVVDVSPIADLMKSEVRELAKYLGVPLSIIVAKPTDGLFGDDRSDEDQLGASYDELEWAMIKKEEGKTADEFKGR